MLSYILRYFKNQFVRSTNYLFCADWVIENSPEDARVLDFGCGAAQTVTELRSKGINAYGCDIFYEGGNLLPNVPTFLLDSNIIRHMSSNYIPFPDSTFDLVVSNQVFEHVEDLSATLLELRRVLRSNGRILLLFPTSASLIEYHVGLPLVHLIPSQSCRFLLVLLLRLIGFGADKDGLTPYQWSQRAVKWIDSWTYYRDPQLLHSLFSNYFTNWNYAEELWLKYRSPFLAKVTSLFGVPFQRFLVQRLGSSVYLIDFSVDSH